MKNCNSHQLNSQLLNYTYNAKSHFKNDGSATREGNRKNSKVLMTFGINMLDDKVVHKLADYLATLSIDETKAFAHYIKVGDVTNKNEMVQKVLDKMSHMILHHKTEVPELRKMLYEYIANVDAIADITKSLVGERDSDKLRDGMTKIKQCFARNELLIDTANEYRELKKKQKQQIQDEAKPAVPQIENSFQIISTNTEVSGKALPRINVNSGYANRKGVTVPMKSHRNPAYILKPSIIMEGDGVR